MRRCNWNIFNILLASSLLAATTVEVMGDDSGEVLTLVEARQRAFSRNWDLLAAKADVDAATAQKIMAKEFPNPTLSLSTQKINVDNHPSGIPGANDLWRRNYDTIVAVNQLFEIGGKRRSRKESAAQGFNGARARLLDAKRTLDLAVAKNYIAALQADENKRILHESAESLRHEATIAEARFHAGDISAADKAQIEIAASRLELDADSAATNAVTARMAVEILLGKEQPRGQWQAGDTLEGLAKLADQTSDTSVHVRPDLVAAEAAVKKAEADLKLARAMRVPDPTVSLQYEHEPQDQPNTIGLGVSFPLPLWNRNNGAIESAEAARQQAQLQYQKTKAQVAADVTSAEFAYGDATARRTRYTREILPKSKQVTEAVAFAYRKGGASLLDLLSAERNDNDIRLATAQSLADQATAVATLLAARNIEWKIAGEKK